MALQIKVASPCSEKWESMRGDERRRFCEKCQLHVHDLRSLVMSVVAVAALFVAVAGLLNGARSRGFDDNGAAPVADALRSRFHAAKESLRSTALFGPLINRFDPSPRMLVGDIVAMPPKTGS
jgi:hypothetical protein